jgi:hypothetical protein
VNSGSLRRRPAKQAGLRRRATRKREACRSQSFTFACRIDACAPRSGADEATALRSFRVFRGLLFFVLFVLFVFFVAMHLQQRSG